MYTCALFKLILTKRYMKMYALHAGQKTDPWLRNSFDADNLFPSNWLNAFDKNSPSVNVAENSNSFCIDVISPGFKKEEFKVDIENNIITFKAGTFVFQHHIKNSSSLWKDEFKSKAFFHSFRLPDNIKEDLITAVYKDDVLQLNIPKNLCAGKKEVPVT